MHAQWTGCTWVICCPNQDVNCHNKVCFTNIIFRAFRLESGTAIINYHFRLLDTALSMINKLLLQIQFCYFLSRRLEKKNMLASLTKLQFSPRFYLFDFLLQKELHFAVFDWDLEMGLGSRGLQLWSNSFKTVKLRRLKF